MTFPARLAPEVHVAGTEQVRVALLDATELALALQQVPLPAEVAGMAMRLRSSLATLQRELATTDLIGRACYVGEHRA